MHRQCRTQGLGLKCKSEVWYCNWIRVACCKWCPQWEYGAQFTFHGQGWQSPSVCLGALLQRRGSFPRSGPGSWRHTALALTYIPSCLCQAGPGATVTAEQVVLQWGLVSGMENTTCSPGDRNLPSQHLPAGWASCRGATCWLMGNNERQCLADLTRGDVLSSVCWASWKCSFPLKGNWGWARQD